LDTHARKGLRWTRLLLALAVLFAVSAPIAVFAAGGHFTDDDTSAFESHINWMADAGITLGCNPPANDLYCPDDNVTRGQMAAFMHRFAQYLDAEDGTPAEADHAADADTLDGESATYYTNPAWGVACDAGSCSDLAMNTPLQMLEIPVTAPMDGYVTVASNYSGTSASATAAYFQIWAEVDTSPGCTSWFLVPGESVPGTWGVGSIAADIDFGNLATTVVTAVGAGDHTLRLCAIATQAVTSYQGSLAITFSAGGSATPAASLDAADYSYLEDAFAVESSN